MSLLIFVYSCYCYIL